DVMLRAVDFIRYMINETKAGNKIEESELEARIEELNEFARFGAVSGARKADEAAPDASQESAAQDKQESHKQELQEQQEAVAKVSTPVETDEKQQISEVSEYSDSANNVIKDSGEDDWIITFKPHEEIMLTGNDPYRYLRELRELGDLHTEVNTRNLSDWGAFDPEYCYLSWEVQLPSSVEKSAIEEIFEWIADDCLFSIEKVSASGEAEELDEGSDQLVTFTEKKTQPTVSGVEKADARPMAGFGKDERSQELTSIRVNIEKVDNLVNLVGELVITQSILNQFTEDITEIDREKLVEGLVQLERNTRQLQEESMRIRMLPIDSVFQRLPRLVRDLSSSLGKKVELKMHGNQTEVDKTVLEKIADPLMHLIRNAMDHGLESPDERVRIGKPETGLVDLSAFHEGGNIIIQVKDDGAGLNKTKILEKAVEKGLIRREEELTDNQIHRLIFAAGFTTAQQLSDVSGRGVGMDVVNKNISDLGGNIDVQSTAGKGCLFTIKLPLTLAIVDSQLVRVGKEVLIIPLLSIVKSVQVTKDDLSDVAGEIPVFRFQDEYIPVIHLDKSFNIKIDEEDTDRILVVVDVGRKVGLLINEVVGLQQVVIKSLESNYKQIKGIAGATILGDGKVSMIIDIGGLIREEESKRSMLAAELSA
ncbi:MAG: chemotaxis protein CheA, partial [Gammaproteobacteria bacterium]|nr:chemotaxis protein CheA [Gammaproteobacteria bacterium]